MLRLPNYNPLSPESPATGQEDSEQTPSLLCTAWTQPWKSRDVDAETVDHIVWRIKSVSGLYAGIRAHGKEFIRF